MIKVEDGVLVSCSLDETIRLWNLNERKCLRKIKTGSSVMSMVVVNEEVLACGCEDGNIYLYELNGALINSLKNKQSVLCLIYFQQNILVSGGINGKITIWDLKTESENVILNGHFDWVKSLVKINIE